MGLVPESESYPGGGHLDGRDLAGSAPRRCKPRSVDCGQRGGGPVSAHLQGSRVVFHLRQPLSDFAVGHGAAQGVVGGLQELQLLLVLSQCLRVAAWVGGTGFSQTGQWARGRKASEMAAGRYSGSPYPRSSRSQAPPVSDSLRPDGLQPTRLLHPWDSPGKSTGVGCPLGPVSSPEPGPVAGTLHLRVPSPRPRPLCRHQVPLT